MQDNVRFFRIFLSSPGDVPQERNDAEVVIREINDSGEFSNHFLLKLFRWDDRTVVLPMPVTDIPQKSVDVYMLRPSECDLVAVLFWTRMGSPLVMDEREYLSGTHYEYSEALEGYKQQGSPTVWLYRCSEEPSIKLSDPQRDERIRQYDRVTQFFAQFRDAEGRLTGGVNEYEMHDSFKALFKAQLLTYLRHLRDKPQSVEPLPSKAEFTGIPYRGLNALGEEDAPIFFGRDAETLEVLSRIENKRLVFVLGASGSGKSSLVAAGVLPKLRERGWRIVRCVPGEDPFYNLSRAMVSQIPEMGVKPTEYLHEARKMADMLRTSAKNLAEQIAMTLPKQRVLLFIDQFEEVFTLASNNPELRSGEVEIFMQAIRQESAELTTILTMRSDFYGVALPHFDVLKQEAYGLTRPSVFSLYDLIVRPAALAGLQLDKGLPQHIVEEVGSESGGLALIAYLMEALYLRAKDRGDTHLTWDDYKELGGVQGTINTLANQAYAALPVAEPERERAMQNVFRGLIALTEEDGQLIPTRRRAPLTEFAPVSLEVQFIDTFVEARLLVRDSAAVEVAHEAILLHWGQLKGWIDRIKGDLALLRQYERDAKTWEERGRDAPPPNHEALIYFYAALENLGLEWDELEEPLRSYTEPEQERLYRELEIIATMHERRRDIGDRLAVIGDTRRGIGVKDGLPEIEWLRVEPGGEIQIKGSKFTVEPFYIARYLVTYAQYQVFAEGDYNNPRWWEGFPEKYRPQELSGARSKMANAPRDTISWYQSVAFARWLDAYLREADLLPDASLQVRLPTEWEWQWAAQNGSEEWKYPWGEWREGYANTSEAGLSRSTAVGMYPQGKAACEALDMVGNLLEWCQNDHGNPEVVDSYGNGEGKVLRGGSFILNQANAAASYRYSRNPYLDHYHFGVRLVLSRPIGGSGLWK